MWNHQQRYDLNLSWDLDVLWRGCVCISVDGYWTHPRIRKRRKTSAQLRYLSSRHRCRSMIHSGVYTRFREISMIELGFAFPCPSLFCRQFLWNELYPCILRFSYVRGEGNWNGKDISTFFNSQFKT